MILFQFLRDQFSEENDCPTFHGNEDWFTAECDSNQEAEKLLDLFVNEIEDPHLGMTWWFEWGEAEYGPSPSIHLTNEQVKEKLK